MPKYHTILCITSWNPIYLCGLEIVHSIKRGLGPRNSMLCCHISTYSFCWRRLFGQIAVSVCSCLVIHCGYMSYIFPKSRYFHCIFLCVIVKFSLHYYFMHTFSNLVPLSYTLCFIAVRATRWQFVNLSHLVNHHIALLDKDKSGFSANNVHMPYDTDLTLQSNTPISPHSIKSPCAGL